jgi:hypothetical protein
LEELRVGAKSVLKSILNGQDLRARAELIWLRIGKSVGLLFW